MRSTVPGPLAEAARPPPCAATTYSPPLELIREPRSSLGFGPPGLVVALKSGFRGGIRGSWSLGLWLLSAMAGDITGE